MPATLSPEEVKALMGAVQDGRIPVDTGRGAHGPVAPYDLTSQDRIIRGQMPTLDALNEQIGGRLAMGLTGRTRMALKVTSAPATLLKFADLSPLLVPPATVCVLGLGAGHGFGLALLEPGLAEALLAAALGDRRSRGPDAPADGRRDFTGVEQLILRRLLTILTDAMAEAWAPVIPFQPEVLRLELDPRMASIAPPGDVGILAAFEIAGAIQGRIQLVIPYSAVEPVKARLAAPRQLAERAHGRAGELLARELEQVEVEVRGLLGHALIPFSRLLELQPGEILLLDSDEGRPLPIRVQGREKLRGHPTVAGGALAMVVETPVAGMPPPLPPPLPPPARSESR